MRRARLVAAFTVSAGGVVSAASPALAAAQDQDAIDAFARQIAADVAADSIGAITAAVFRGDHVLWAQGFGWADPEHGVPAGVRTIYRIGSISKSFTAMLLVDLVEDGVIALDDPVSSVLPEVAGFGEAQTGEAPEGTVSAGTTAVTFRELASHTAGLIREPDLEGAAAGPIEDWGHKILASIPHTSFYTSPGTEYRYSNIGFGILGYALQRAAGRSFMQMIDERIFTPLGMHSSTFIVGPDLAPRLAVGFANRPDGTVDADFPALEHAGRGYKVPNGGVYSTVGDLATFAAAVMGRTDHEVLETASRAEMMRRQTPTDGPGYGLGLSINEVSLADGSSVTFIGHGGSVAGYNAYLAFEPESGTGVVLLRNYNRGRTNLGRAGNALLTALADAER